MFDKEKLQKAIDDLAKQYPELYREESKIPEERKLEKKKFDKFSVDIPSKTSGVCNCGCLGRPYKHEFDKEINITIYKYCPARIARKENENRDKIIAYQKRLDSWRERDKLNQPATSKAEAQLRDLRVFIGKKCRKCGTQEKTDLGFCVRCKKADNILRKAMRRGAFPEDLSLEDKNKISEIYERCKQVSIETGIPHHVDHIKPLAKGGRHHPSNLRIITAEENMKKGATWKRF